MRKILYRKWIPADYHHPYSKMGGVHTPIEGTNCWETDFRHEGAFHQWGTGYKETSNGLISYTVALVETQNGLIIEVLPNNIKFI